MLSYRFPSQKFSFNAIEGLKEEAKYTLLILAFIALKVTLNLLANTHFGLQRDELLYVVLGEHLDWGFKEVPPFIPLLARLSSVFFGNSLFATRLISTIFGGLIIWFTGRIVREFGGGRFAISLACLALIFSPVFAASDYLFEPVVYDQLWWVLMAWLLIRYVKTSSIKYLYLLGLITGLGLLTKYSVLFFGMSLTTGLLANRQLNIFWNKHTLRACLLTLLLISPNLAWELWHHMPVIRQMNELGATQLSRITPFDFITQQLVLNGASLLLWLPGLALLLFSKRLHPFRFLAFSYLVVFVILLILHGKNYYISGAYPMLFAAGGCCIEKMLIKSVWMRNLSVLLLVAPNLVVFPLALPVLSRNQTLTLFQFEREHLPFLLFAAKWDDDKIHPLTQNYGVMCGWEEMAEKVAKIYHGLSPNKQQHTVIYAGNYGEASAVQVYGKQYNLPEVVCLNSSFSLWAPPKINADYIIDIDEMGYKSMRTLVSQTKDCQQAAEIADPIAVEKGAGIFLLSHPNRTFFDHYEKACSFLKTH
jgi:hypothetical protein